NNIWQAEPANVERAPDGPAAGEPVGAWLAITSASLPYTITLTGACFVVGGCYPNCDGSTLLPILNANDFVCFLNKYATNSPYADCDGVGGLTANDFQCFLNAYAAGCS